MFWYSSKKILMCQFIWKYQLEWKFLDLKDFICFLPQLASSPVIEMAGKGAASQMRRRRGWGIASASASVSASAAAPSSFSHGNGGPGDGSSRPLRKGSPHTPRSLRTKGVAAATATVEER